MNILMLKTLISRILEKKLAILGILCLLLLRKLVQLRHEKRELQRELLKNLFFKKKSTELTISTILSQLPPMDDRKKETIVKSDIPALLTLLEARKISNLDILVAYFSNTITSFRKFDPIHEITLGRAIYKIKSPKFKKPRREKDLFIPFSVQNKFEVKGFDTRAQSKSSSIFRPTGKDHPLIRKLAFFGFVPIFTSQTVSEDKKSGIDDKKPNDEAQSVDETENDVKLLLQDTSRFALLAVSEISCLSSVIVKGLHVVSFSPDRINFDPSAQPTTSQDQSHPRITLLSRHPHDLILASHALLNQERELGEPDGVRTVNSNFRIAEGQGTVGYLTLFNDPNDEQIDLISQDWMFQALENKGHQINLIHTHFFERCLKYIKDPTADESLFSEENEENEGAAEVVRKMLINKSFNSQISKISHLKATENEKKVTLLQKIKFAQNDFEFLWDSLDSKVLLLPFSQRDLSSNYIETHDFFQEFGHLLKLLNYSFIALGVKPPSDAADTNKNKPNNPIIPIFEAYFIICRAGDELHALDLMTDVYG